MGRGNRICGETPSAAGSFDFPTGTTSAQARGGGGQISAAYRRRTGGPHSYAKTPVFLKEKAHFALSFSACENCFLSLSSSTVTARAVLFLFKVIGQTFYAQVRRRSFHTVW